MHQFNDHIPDKAGLAICTLIFLCPSVTETWCFFCIRSKTFHAVVNTIVCVDSHWVYVSLSLLVSAVSVGWWQVRLISKKAASQISKVCMRLHLQKWLEAFPLTRSYPDAVVSSWVAQLVGRRRNAPSFGGGVLCPYVDMATYTYTVPLEELRRIKIKVKGGFPIRYSILSVGPGADPGVQAVGILYVHTICRILPSKLLRFANPDWGFGNLGYIRDAHWANIKWPHHWAVCCSSCRVRR